MKIIFPILLWGLSGIIWRVYNVRYGVDIDFIGYVLMFISFVVFGLGTILWHEILNKNV